MRRMDTAFLLHLRQVSDVNVKMSWLDLYSGRFGTGNFPVGLFSLLVVDGPWQQELHISASLSLMLANSCHP